jgi:hypothetical protein
MNYSLSLPVPHDGRIGVIGCASGLRVWPERKDMVEKSLALDLAQVAVNQRGWAPELGYFHPGCGFVVDRTGEVTAAIPGRFIFEHLRPEVAVGWVTKPGAARNAM